MIVHPTFLVQGPLSLLPTSAPLSLLSTSDVQSLTTASTTAAASVVDFTDPGKDLFLAYVVFSLLAGVKALADGWRPTVTSGKNKKK